MQRRDFIAGIGSAAAWPVVARSQQRTVPVIGYLNWGNDTSGPGPQTPLNAAFHRGLNEQGFAEGRNFQILYRWADGRSDRLPELASDLVQRRVSLIFANPDDAALAAKAATATIPVVFATGYDPVAVVWLRASTDQGAISRA
jgi:putative ABC transport system substrate-binding protein